MVQHLLLGRHQGLKHVVDPRLVIPGAAGNKISSHHVIGHASCLQGAKGPQHTVLMTKLCSQHTNAAGSGHDLHH